MSDNTETKTPDPAIAAATAAAAKASADLTATREEMARLQGQLSVLTAAATSGNENKAEELGDIVGDTKSVLDKHFEKRAGVLLAEQAEIGAATQRDLTAVKRAEDWKEFGPEVEKMVQTNGINKSILSRPGTYEQLLDMVKAKHIDVIVAKKVADAEAKAKDEATKAAAAAALSSPGGSKGREERREVLSFNDKQKHVLSKLGVDETAAAKLHESVEDDGVWVTGPAWK